MFDAHLLRSVDAHLFGSVDAHLFRHPKVAPHREHSNNGDHGNKECLTPTVPAVCDLTFPRT